jgi:hypothetical protein
LQLSGAYDQLKRNFETDEVREARDIMELANAMAEDPHLYTSGIVHDSAVETFGAEYGRYIDKTEAFFSSEANSAFKPADFVDPEIKARQSSSSSLDWSEEDRAAFRALRELVKKDREAREVAE